MAVLRLSRWIALLMAALVAGCSVIGSGSDRNDECRGKRSSCMYEGKYDPDEREYAEEEAARLNKAEARRLRRGW